MISCIANKNRRHFGGPSTCFTNTWSNHLGSPMTKGKYCFPNVSPLKKSSRESWSLQTYTYIYIYIYILYIYISYIYIYYISYIYIHITPFGNQTWLAGQSIKKHGNNMDLHWVVTRRRHASDGRVGSITVCERCMEVAKMCIPFPPIMYIVYMHIYIYIYMYRCLVSSHFLVLIPQVSLRGPRS